MLFGASFEDKLTALGMKCLTVAGGFVVGYLIGWLIAVGANKWVFKRDRTPEGLKRILQVVCGLALALLIAVSLMWGSGDGAGGDKDKSGTSDSTQDKKSGPPPSADPPKDTKTATPATPIDPRPTELTIRVTIVGGAGVTNEFYLIDDDTKLKSFDELKTEITRRIAGEKRKTVVAVLMAKDPMKRLPTEHGVVTRLIDWVKNTAKLDVSLPAEK